MDARKRLTAKERGSYHAYLNNPNVSCSKLPRKSLYRRKKNKQAAGESPTDSFLSDSYSLATTKDEQTEQNPPEQLNKEFEGPTSSNKLSEELGSDTLGEDMLETEVLETEEVEMKVPFLDQSTLDYPEDISFDDHVKENDETGDKNDDDDIILLEEVLDHENNENANSDAYDDAEITISEKPIFDGSPLTLTMHVIAINTFGMTEHLSGSTLAHLHTLIWLHCPKPNNCIRSLRQLWGSFKDFHNPIEWHYMCTNCKKYIVKINLVQLNTACAALIVFPIVQQLLVFFKTVFCKPV